MIWNVGKIAGSGHPGALQLIRRILLACAAIPDAFPPQMLDVTLAGEAHQEMDVDGGAIAQAFIYPLALTEGRRELIARGIQVRQGRIFLIRKARLDPDWALVERRTLGITGRAISTMLAASGRNDVLRIWNTAQRDRLDFHPGFIGTDFNVPCDRPFDPDYMRPLFDNGFQRARNGFNWPHEPPMLDGRPRVPEPAMPPTPPQSRRQGWPSLSLAGLCTGFPRHLAPTGRRRAAPGGRRRAGSARHLAQAQCAV